MPIEQAEYFLKLGRIDLNRCLIEINEKMGAPIWLWILDGDVGPLIAENAQLHIALNRNNPLVRGFAPPRSRIR